MTPASFPMLKLTLKECIQPSAMAIAVFDAGHLSHMMLLGGGLLPGYWNWF